MVKKKLLSVVLVASTVCSMLLTGCGSDAGNTESGSADTSTAAQTEEAVADDIEKPEKITIMVSGDFQATQANGQEEWIARWEELTGIKLEIIQPDHSSYYDVLGQTLASGPENWPDIIYVGNSYYSGYAAEGVLWDMTDAWNNSELKKNPNTDASAVEGNMIDGHLYGLPLASGGGCMTYIRKQWLDNCGLDVPTNYEEYLEMLDAFTNGDPDGDGINGNTVAVSAAGFVNGNAPYVNYLPEFYQDAYPSFYQGEDGVWKDGFTEDSMKAAIQRLQDAYNKGYIDKETLTNGTSNCRTKFYEGKFGVFTYWAGGWAETLSNGISANGLDGELVFMPPIAEVGQYWERNAPVYAITSYCKKRKINTFDKLSLILQELKDRKRKWIKYVDWTVISGILYSLIPDFIKEILVGGDFTGKIIHGTGLILIISIIFNVIRSEFEKFREMLNSVNAFSNLKRLEDLVFYMAMKCKR